MRKLQLFFKSLFSSKQVENEGVLKEEDSPIPASTPKEARSELETDMEEFNLRKSTNSGITTSNANQTIITLNSHQLIIDKDGAFRIIDTKNQNKLILSKQSDV